MTTDPVIVVLLSVALSVCGLLFARVARHEFEIAKLNQLVKYLMDRERL